MPCPLPPTHTPTHTEPALQLRLQLGLSLDHTPFLPPACVGLLPMLCLPPVRVLVHDLQDGAHPRGVWRRTTLESYRLGAATVWETVLDLDALGQVRLHYKGANLEEIEGKIGGGVLSGLHTHVRFFLLSSLTPSLLPST